VPVPDALADQEPSFDAVPEANAAIQSEGSDMETRSVPEAAVAQSAGGDPV